MKFSDNSKKFGTVWHSAAIYRGPYGVFLWCGSVFRETRKSETSRNLNLGHSNALPKGETSEHRTIGVLHGFVNTRRFCKYATIFSGLRIPAFHLRY